jgi:hypothetical protein
VDESGLFVDHPKVSTSQYIHGLNSADFKHSGAWLVASACMLPLFGREILRGLSLAAEAPRPEEVSSKEPTN